MFLLVKTFIFTSRSPLALLMLLYGEKPHAFLEKKKHFWRVFQYFVHVKSYIFRADLINGASNYNSDWLCIMYKMYSIKIVTVYNLVMHTPQTKF